MSSRPPSADPCAPGALGTRAIARFFAPLALNAWLMTLAGPVLNVAIGRAADPRLELAAFWLAFSILLVCQSACLVLQPVTASALLRRAPFSALALAAGLLGVAGSVLVLAVARTPLGDVLFTRLIPTSAPTAALARTVLTHLAALPLLVALRGFANGVAVFERRTELLASATFVRIALLTLLTAAVLAFGRAAGGRFAADMLVGATAAEAAFLGFAVLRDGRVRREGAAQHATPGVLPLLGRLAVPLAAASLVWAAARPLVGAVLARLAAPDLAQAAYGVVLPVLFATCAPLWAFLDVALVLPRDAADLARIVRFASLAALAFAGGIALLAWTPLDALWRHPGAPLPADLSRLVRPAIALAALEPLVLSARAIAQGLLVRAGRGGLVLALSPVKLACMLAAGLFVTRVAPHANGALLAIALLVGGDAVDALLLGAAATRVAGPLLRAAVAEADGVREAA